MTDFFAVIFNPHLVFQFPHVVASGVTTAAFFVLGISAYHLLRKDHEELAGFRISFRTAIVYALVGVLAVILVGHGQTQHMVQAQPMKMAAAEALWESEDPASFSLISIPIQREQRDLFSIRVPYGLSLLSYNSLQGEVKGIKNLQAEYEATYGPGDYVPPVTVNYFSFRIMVGAGFLMAALALVGAYLARKDRLEGTPIFLKALLPAMALPYLANTAGWILTEIGRQPWIVFGLQKTEAAVSPSVSVGELLFSLIAFALVYGILIVVDVSLLARFARQAPAQEAVAGAPETDPALSLL